MAKMKRWRWIVELKPEAGRSGRTLPKRKFSVVFEEGCYFVDGVRVVGFCDPAKDNIAKIIREFISKRYGLPKRQVTVRLRSAQQERATLPLWRVKYSDQYYASKWLSRTLQVVRARDENDACRMVGGENVGLPTHHLTATRTFRQ